MARYKKYIETNVLDEAKNRLRHIFETFDSVVTTFSGGKDSLVLLHLTKEVAAEFGIKKIKVVFRDDEAINQDVIDFVEEYRNLDWLDLEWWTVQTKGGKFVLNTIESYVQWDETREWVRPKPSWALSNEDLGIPKDTLLSPTDYDDIIARRNVGKVCILTGVRAAESLVRYRSCVNKMNENYIVASQSNKAKLGRPIFDWQENDVFKYFYDNKIKYCPIYDKQMWNQNSLRVSSLLHSDAAKKGFGDIRKLDPDTYERLIELFPEMTLTERYTKELDNAIDFEKYGQNWDGVKQFLVDTVINPESLEYALTQLNSVIVRSRRTPNSYPIEYVLKQFNNGNGQGRAHGKGTIQPLGAKK
jgi:predicted phosphoadenosine phosphosulfate sulfurtransferase